MICSQGPALRPGFYFMYNIWQDAGIRTRIAATAARYATNKVHTSLFLIFLVFLVFEQGAAASAGLTISRS